MIYQPAVADGFEWVNCANDEDYEIFNSFDGSSRIDNWTPVHVRRVCADDGTAFARSDFPWLGEHALVMRARAVEALRGWLIPNSEVLPLRTDDGAELFVLNVTRILDALDEERSDILRFPGSNRIMFVQSAVLREPVVRGLDIFRLPYRGSATYVSDRFAKAVRDAGLAGLKFERVETSGENPST